MTPIGGYKVPDVAQVNLQLGGGGLSRNFS